MQPLPLCLLRNLRQRLHRLRTFAGTKPFPHVFTFSDSNPEGGKAALAAHAERLAAAEAEKAEKAAAAAKIKEETAAIWRVPVAWAADTQLVGNSRWTKS